MFEVIVYSRENVLKSISFNDVVFFPGRPILLDLLIPSLDEEGFSTVFSSATYRPISGFEHDLNSDSGCDEFGPTPWT